MHPTALVFSLLALAGCASSVTTTDAGADVDAGAAPIVQIAGAGTSMCALRRDGHVRCWSWYAPSVHALPPLAPSEVAGLDDAVEIAVSPNYSGPGCAVRASGSVACWPPATDTAPTTTAITLELAAPARHVAVASSHQCALDAEGAISCWGDNRVGQLGTGDFTARDAPTRVAGLPPMVEVRAGESNTCARTADGAVWCWGRNYAGALGDGLAQHACERASPDEDCSATPVRVASIDAADGLSVGLNGACATQRGEALCWGWGTGGRLGNGATTDQRTPRAVPGLTAVTAVFAGYLDGCAIHAGGSLSCWGLDFGEPAESDGGAQPVLPPTPVPAVGRVAGVSGGWYHKCALTLGGRVLCWGARHAPNTALPPVPRTAPIEVTGL